MLKDRFKRLFFPLTPKDVRSTPILAVLINELNNQKLTLSWTGLAIGV
jgi:hypothetical protein